MVRRNSGVILRQVHALFNVGTFSGLSDRQLLDRFLARHDEVSEFAFTVLVERHGPMVLGVCRRILVDPHDAEDAFQATFLVLVRKAGSVRVDGSVGRWLFGVATRVATRARADARRRRGRERPGLERLKVVAVEESLPAVDRADLQSILAEEIGRLPVRLQAPVILCDLEGCSYEQSAQQLGWPVGTVKSRLSRARALLRTRLTRRGLVPDDRAITIPLLPMSLSRGLIETTTRAAQSLVAGRLTTIGVVSASVATLTEGVLRTMYWTKLKLAITATLLIVGGSAVVFSQAPAQKLESRSGAGTGSAAPAGGANPVAARGDELDVIMLDRAWVDAIPRRDAAIVDRILADDFEGIDAAGKLFAKANYLPDLRNGAFGVQTIELDEIKTRLFGETAVVTSRIKIAGHLTPGRITNVYFKRLGRWQCVASHASGIVGIGVFCPIADLPAKAASIHDLGDREPRGQGTRPGNLGNNCIDCHSINHQARNPPSQFRDAAIRATVSGSDAGKTQSIGVVHFEIDYRVEKVLVPVGEIVLKGHPLLELSSKELAEAKGNYEMACIQWAHDKKIWEYKAPMVKQNTLAKNELIEVESDEAQSRLKMKLARDKLMIYGLTEEDIKQIPSEDGERRTRFLLRSPVDGKIIRIVATSGGSYNTRETLMDIEPISPPRPAGR
jgi:RNA polymerase sigma factor (sigma-70 family)